MKLPLAMGLWVILTGLIIAGVSIPLILRMVPLNGLYGVRTAKTLSSPTAWYAGNVYGGKALLIAGLTTIIIGLLIPVLTTRLQWNSGTIQIVGVVAELAPIIIALVAIMAYLRSRLA